MKKPDRKLKPFPSFKTDEEAEEFVATADLSEYDISGCKVVRFQFTNRHCDADKSTKTPD